ncbi:Luciferase-like monooxygenase [Arboricoccus pini]|uniref:Luciferase-like monooxygenase n=1 Tax=Arboricoccus pini TaxID=1963835 RepID=A0A212RS06_9PROT|nr:LLM class flavin-dependent oxidoreductase [Arboricoccus pini]SNB75425.1 Luciferase-like monooxygenase [Arboricoccus pini]
MSPREKPGAIVGVLRDTRRMVETAEDADFDIAWCAEHHFTHYSISASPLLLAAHAAGYSKHIRLGAVALRTH